MFFSAVQVVNHQAVWGLQQAHYKWYSVTKLAYCFDMCYLCFFHSDLDTTNLPRMIVLQKGPRGFGFVVRGRRGVPGEFQPSLEVPALQYLEKIDAGSAADRASLKPGDYILEVNGTNVTTMSHEAVVQLIRSSGDILGMKVITVGSSQGLRNFGSLDAQAQ
ncbi:hypothetical protein P879_01382, partial [Paragonimus westermani]